MQEYGGPTTAVERCTSPYMHVFGPGKGEGRMSRSETRCKRFRTLFIRDGVEQQGDVERPHTNRIFSSQLYQTFSCTEGMILRAPERTASTALRAMSLQFRNHWGTRKGSTTSPERLFQRDHHRRVVDAQQMSGKRKGIYLVHGRNPPRLCLPCMHMY